MMIIHIHFFIYNTTLLLYVPYISMSYTGLVEFLHFTSKLYVPYISMSYTGGTS